MNFAQNYSFALKDRVRRVRVSLSISLRILSITPEWVNQGLKVAKQNLRLARWCDLSVTEMKPVVFEGEITQRDRKRRVLWHKKTVFGLWAINSLAWLHCTLQFKCFMTHFPHYHKTSWPVKSTLRSVNTFLLVYPWSFTTWI